MSTEKQQCETPDQISQVAVSFLTISTMEALRRFHQRVGVNVPCVAGEELETTVRKLSEELIAECETEGSKGTEKTTSPMQKLKSDLKDWYDDFYNMLVDQVRDEVLDEVKATLKMELRMELFTELKSMADKLPTAPNRTTKQTTPTTRDFGAGTLASFDTELASTGPGLKTPVSGFESVASHFTFNRKPQKSEKETEDELMKNPLYARISKTVDRNKKGESAYTADELIEIRKQRGMSEEDETHMRERLEMASFNFEDEDPEVAAKFEKAFQDKYGFKMT